LVFFCLYFQGFLNKPQNVILIFFLYFFKASIIAHKKEASFESYRSLRDEYNHIQQVLDQKREMVKEQGGGEVLKGEDVRL
jgi:hypothetical protein